MLIVKTIMLMSLYQMDVLLMLQLNVHQPRNALLSDKSVQKLIDVHNNFHSYVKSTNNVLKMLSNVNKPRQNVYLMNRDAQMDHVILIIINVLSTMDVLSANLI